MKNNTTPVCMGGIFASPLAHVQQKETVEEKKTAQDASKTFKSTFLAFFVAGCEDLAALQ